MKPIQNYFIAVFILLILLNTTYSLDLPPLKPRVLLISDGEFLRYDIFIAGEKYQDVNIVSRISEDSNYISVYIGKHNMNSRYPMPKHYTNYQRQFIIDLKTGSLIKSFGDYIAQYKLDNRNGEAYFSLEIDTNNNIANYIAKFWDGYEFMQKTSRVPLKKGYPAWDIPSIAFVGSRYMDINGNGMLYGVVPAYVKEAVPVVGRVIKKEVVVTSAGKFNTIKYGVGIPNAFLAQLLETYVKELYLWLEDSPRSLVIKTTTPDETYLLKEVSNW